MPFRNAPLRDPDRVSDCFALGVDIENHGDYVRLVFWRDATARDGRTKRRRIRQRIVMPMTHYRLAVGDMASPSALGI